MRKVTMMAAVAAVAMAAQVQAAQLLDFKPDPITGNIPEFTYDAGGVFHSAAGTDFAMGGGLIVSVPFIVPGVIAGKTIVGGTTNFADVSMLFASVGSLGVAHTVPVFPGITSTGIALDSGSFTLTARDGTVLLHGTFGVGFMGGITGSMVASYQTDQVSYDAGAIKDVLSPGILFGQASISLNDLSTPVSVDARSQLFSSFDANATGLFSVVPEPTSAGLLALPVALLGRRRK